MHIYIDESGSFAIPKRQPSPSISCIGALVVPDSTHDAILADFQVQSAGWPKENGEVKGKLLDEAQMDTALFFLAGRGVMFDCVAVDLGLHRTVEIIAHKERNAQNVMKNITALHQPGLVQELRQLQSALRSVSPPEYLQIVVLTELVYAVLTTKLLYFAQCAPQEIGAFQWVIDAKDKSVTRSERLWNLLVLPWIQSRSLRQPLIHLIGADYSAHEQFMHEADNPPEHIAPSVRDWKPGERFFYSDNHLIMEDRRFESSANTLGLQMVDVVTSAARRALMGRLGISGWRHLASLMLRSIGKTEIIHLVQVHPQRRGWRPEPHYYRVLRILKKLARSPVITNTGGENQRSASTA